MIEPMSVLTLGLWLGFRATGRGWLFFLAILWAGLYAPIGLVGGVGVLMVLAARQREMRKGLA